MVQLDLTSYITSIAISPTGAYMTFGDADGAIHVLSQVEDVGSVPLNGFDGHPIEVANSPSPLPEIEWDDNTYVAKVESLDRLECHAFRPLNSIGIPHYDSELLSAWSPLFISGTTEYLPSPKVPLQVTSTMKYNEGIAYAALPKELRGRRNVVSSGRKKTNGRFRSGKTHSIEVCPSISHRLLLTFLAGAGYSSLR
jgi:PAB-dependent poly(A)-specific ribonuclease subunit 2